MIFTNVHNIYKNTINEIYKVLKNQNTNFLIFFKTKLKTL